jgi:hypothetical protein
MENPFCGECGQPIGTPAAHFTWRASPHAWWAWGLIVFGVALAVTFALGAWQVSRERSATQEILQGSPAADASLEGPSVQRKLLASAAPAGTADPSDAAEHQLNRYLVDSGFGLTMAVLGIAVLARRSVQDWLARRSQASGLGAGVSPGDSVLRTLLEVWTLVELILLSAIRLMAVALLYLLGTQITTSGPPTWNVIQATLDQLIQIVVGLPNQVH